MMSSVDVKEGVAGNDGGRERCKVVLAYAYGRANAGDHALTLGALELLRGIEEPLQLTVISRFAFHGPDDAREDVTRSWPHVAYCQSPFRFSRSTRFARIAERCWGALVACVALFLPRRLLKHIFKGNDAITAILNADVMLINGGNLLYWNRYRKAPGRLVGLTLPALIARRFSIPYAFLPQTMGPFEGVMARIILRRVLSDAVFVACRESVSMNHARSIMSTFGKPKKSVDLACFLGPKASRSNTRGTGYGPGDRGTLAVTVRATQLGDPELSGASPRREVEQLVVNALHEIIVRSIPQDVARIIVVEQTVVDRLASESMLRILGQSGYRVEYVSERDPFKLMQLYGTVGMLIGMRLHSVIFSLNAATPAVSLHLPHFGPKGPGIMADFGLEQWSFDLERNRHDDMVEGVGNCWRERVALRKSLEERMFEARTAALHDLRKRIRDLIRGEANMVRQ